MTAKKIIAREYKCRYKALLDNRNDGVYLGSLTVSCFNTNMIRKLALLAVARAKLCVSTLKWYIVALCWARSLVNVSTSL